MAPGHGLAGGWGKWLDKNRNSANERDGIISQDSVENTCLKILTGSLHVCVTCSCVCVCVCVCVACMQLLWCPASGVFIRWQRSVIQVCTQGPICSVLPIRVNTCVWFSACVWGGGYLSLCLMCLMIRCFAMSVTLGFFSLLRSLSLYRRISLKTSACFVANCLDSEIRVPREC